ncbi:hypothetical protein GCM10022226_58220 [Sphaerisporangium flaviroseum]|uniref:YbaB/EbfC family DNA-binding protein n=1 Tax=Sphaerisporangium flaviroseum TaxID=509199 RepID=A0ABP7IYN1_9ACTN
MPPSGQWADDLERLELIVRQTEEVMRDLGDAQAQIKEITGEGEGADGMVQVVSGSGGRLKTITMDPRVMRLDPGDLGREMTRAVQAAQDAAERSSLEIIDRVRARAATLEEPLDETFVRRRVERVAREIDAD